MVAKSRHDLPKEIATKITKGGQITLPAEAREALGVKPGDQVYIRIEKGEVRVVKPPYQLRDLKGILPAPRPGYNVEQAVREAGEEMADELMWKMQHGRG
jgi:antitoxin PrlF